MQIAQPLRRRVWPWAAAAGLVIGNLFLHKPISDVCDAVFASIGRRPYERLTLAGCAALSAFGALLLLRGRLAVVRRPRRAASLIVLAAATLTAQRWLLVSNVELIHLPQFGLLAALLLAGGLDPQTAWIGATVGGVIDEVYQYLVIYAQVPGVYLDYNDIVLNTLGAAWAVTLAAPPRRRAGTGMAARPARGPARRAGGCAAARAAAYRGARRLPLLATDARARRHRPRVSCHVGVGGVGGRPVGVVFGRPRDRRSAAAARGGRPGECSRDGVDRAGGRRLRGVGARGRRRRARRRCG